MEAHMGRRTMARAIRLLQILRLLKDRPHSVAELAAACGVSERTARRDLLDLQGEPIYAPLLRREERTTRWRFLGDCP
ncbi:MAG: HTH domain-containing protein [Actinobacteria bacterium]|nr:HTH domain-containing protein [Actinomycetota bacterium]